MNRNILFLFLMLLGLGVSHVNADERGNIIASIEKMNKASQKALEAGKKLEEALAKGAGSIKEAEKEFDNMLDLIDQSIKITDNNSKLWSDLERWIGDIQASISDITNDANSTKDAELKKELLKLADDLKTDLDDAIRLKRNIEGIQGENKELMVEVERKRKLIRARISVSKTKQIVRYLEELESALKASNTSMRTLLGQAKSTNPVPKPRGPSTH